MAISYKPGCGNLCILCLCLILSVTVCVQGVPAERGRSNPKSGTKLAGEDTNQLRKAVGGAEVPLLPPGEELGLAELSQERRWLRLADSEEDGVSGDGGPAMGNEWISGDDETPLHTLIPFQKPQLPKGKAE
ncbi:uncharacterized protein LOC144500924 [Mustelus asterias]